MHKTKRNAHGKRIMTKSEAKNVRVSLKMAAIIALREMVAETEETTDKEMASRAILAYYKAWRQHKDEISRKAIVTE